MTEKIVPKTTIKFCTVCKTRREHKVILVNPQSRRYWVRCTKCGNGDTEIF